MAFVVPDNFRSIEGISSPVARVGTALKNGLDDAATAWLEPPFDTSGRKPHFVVLLPDHGLAVIEVLDVRASKLLGVLRGSLRVERDGREVDEDPLARAEAHAEALRARIAQEPRLEGLRFPVASFAAFPSLDRDEAEARGLERTEFLPRALFRNELEAAMQGDTAAELDRWFAKRLGIADPVEGSLEDVVRGLIQPATVIDTNGEEQMLIFRSGEEDVVRVMDRRQESLAKSMGEGHRVVRGVAGSGKTLVLVSRARLFAELYPRQRFLMTCYTRSLASQLRLLLADHDNVDVMHVDGLMEKAIREAKLAAPTYEEDREGEERAKVAVQALERGALTRYRAVFVDEAQDLGTNALIFARMLADARFDDLLIVADAAQNIFRRKFSWKSAGINAQGRSKILRVNYRNTREILDLASVFLLAGGSLRADAAPDIEDENAVVPPQAAARTGAEPTVVITGREEIVDAIAAAAADLLPDRPGPKQVAILTLGNREAIDVSQRLGAQKVEHFFVSDPQRKANRDRIAEATAPVILSTVYSAKGMEFPAVVVGCTPRVADQDADSLRREIYVGMTRATERLAVVAADDHPLAADLRGAAEATGRLAIGMPEE